MGRQMMNDAIGCLCCAARCGTTAVDDGLPVKGHLTVEAPNHTLVFRKEKPPVAFPAAELARNYSGGAGYGNRSMKSGGKLVAELIRTS
jgi:hypothetical protein